jgi:hypothetical protein
MIGKWWGQTRYRGVLTTGSCFWIDEQTSRAPSYKGNHRYITKLDWEEENLYILQFIHSINSGIQINSFNTVIILKCICYNHSVPCATDMWIYTYCFLGKWWTGLLTFWHKYFPRQWITIITLPCRNPLRKTYSHALCSQTRRGAYQYNCAQGSTKYHCRELKYIAVVVRTAASVHSFRYQASRQASSCACNQQLIPLLTTKSTNHW